MFGFLVSYFYIAFWDGHGEVQDHRPSFHTSRWLTVRLNSMDNFGKVHKAQMISSMCSRWGCCFFCCFWKQNDMLGIFG